MRSVRSLTSGDQLHRATPKPMAYKITSRTLKGHLAKLVNEHQTDWATYTPWGCCILHPSRPVWIPAHLEDVAFSIHPDSWDTCTPWGCCILHPSRPVGIPAYLEDVVFSIHPDQLGCYTPWGCCILHPSRPVRTLHTLRMLHSPSIQTNWDATHLEDVVFSIQPDQLGCYTPWGCCILHPPRPVGIPAHLEDVAFAIHPDQLGCYTPWGCCILHPTRPIGMLHTLRMLYSPSIQTSWDTCTPWGCCILHPSRPC